MPNAIPPGGQQAGGGGTSGSGPFASALRSLAIKADTKDDEPATNESGTDLSTREGIASGGGAVAYERSRDANQPANLSKPSAGANNSSRGSVPQHLDHSRALHHGQVTNQERGRTDSSMNDDRLAQKKKLAASPPPEKVATIRSTT